MQATSSLRISKDINSDDFWIITKSTQEWSSDYRSTPNAIEGSPTLFLRAYGESVAAFFGYELLDENTIKVPRPAYINKKTAELNEALPGPERIAVHFYETDDSPQTAENYLRRFTKDLAFPIAGTGTVAIHDTSYHYGSIFFPTSALATALAQTELFLKFIDYLRAKDFKDSNSIEKLFFEMSLNIDSATGNFTHFLAQKEPPKNSAYWILSREGVPADKYLKWFIQAVFRNDPQALNSLTPLLNDFFLDSDNFGALDKICLGPTAVIFEKLITDKIAAVKKITEVGLTV
jgi:hypothetical protein